MDWCFVCKVIKHSKTVHYTSFQYVICFAHIIIVLMHVCMSKWLHFLWGLSFIHNQWVYRHSVSIYLGATGRKMETISFGKNAQENKECSLKCAHSFVVLSFVVVAAVLNLSTLSRAASCTTKDKPCCTSLCNMPDHSDIHVLNQVLQTKCIYRHLYKI